MILHGPELLLTDLNSGEKPQNCTKTDIISEAQYLGLGSMSSDEHFQNWCDPVGRNETPMVLEFEQNAEWSVFVSTKDKEMMQLHLMVTNFPMLNVLKC